MNDEQLDTGEDMVAREVAVWDDTPEQRYSQEELKGILDQAVVPRHAGAGLEAPVLRELGALEGAEMRLGISDVDR